MRRGGSRNSGRGFGLPLRGHDNGRGSGRARGQRSNGYVNISRSFEPVGSSELEDLSDMQIAGEMNAHLPERFQSGQRFDDLEQRSADNPPVSLNVDIRRYVHQQDEISASAKASAWQRMPEVPTNQEVAVMLNELVLLFPNKIDKPWKSVDKYLSTHFQLLREDAISPLRDAVDKFKDDPNMMDNHHMAIYEKVRIVGFVFSHTGIAARIQFSTRRAQRNILWQGSKRLVSGGIVALSPVGDNFSNKCIVAVVAARPIDGVLANPPEIDIFFIRSEDIEIDSRQEWVMVEARTGYFEAYRHTLRALQKLSHEPFPLARNICKLDPIIEPPTYLQDNPVIDLSSAASVDAPHGYGLVDVVNSWPGPDQSNLDTTQWESLRQILTKSLAIVQGPPGTGKTYVSTVALEVLNKNTKQGDPPIIIAAQTNHALDQLLEHVSRFESDYIRLGGRSTSMEVKKHALYEIRKKQRINLIPGGCLGKASSNNHLQSKAMLDTLKPLYQDPGRAIPADTFVKFRVLSEQQALSIPAGSSRWINSSAEEVHPMDMWLSGALMPYPVDREDNDFGFAEEDEDLELEQLREQEAEHGVNDEEDAQDILQGQWCSVSQKIGVEVPSDTEIGEADKALASSIDLWKIPERKRSAVYYVMHERLKHAMLRKFREQADVYNRNLKDLRIGKWERDAVFLSRAKIIGLTTTGLSKYRPLIASLKPKIVLIEEAAEVLEAPITVASMESVEHLILVGDHQQLQGHCSVDELAKKFNLNVSMFERLVNNKMPFTTLLSQRRMHPDFRKLLVPIYPRLKDHPSILARPSRDWGMGDFRSFFFDHEWHESRDAQMSTYNEQEAVFVAGFYRWLVLNGIPPREITLLTLYNGHRKRLLKEIRKIPELAQVYNNVKTVYSYQGEENTIILLCLARHNYDYKIGFLEDHHRVCVALSRAREGFYIFGSTTVLAKNRLWMSVVTRMKAQGRLGSSLPVICKQHGKLLRMENPEDWNGSLGGCKEKCLEVLACGHVCALKCHPFSHETVSCVLNCQKRLVCGHTCRLRCYETCSCDCDVFQNELVPQRPRITYSASDARHGGYESTREYRGRPDDFGVPLTADHPTIAVEDSVSQNFVNGRYLSGRYSPHDGHIYLPGQGSKLTDQPQMLEDGQRATSTLGTMSRSSNRESYGRVAGRRHYPTSPLAASRFTNPEQEHGLRNWSGFAKGGVQVDDYQRSLAGSPKRMKLAAQDQQRASPSSQIWAQAGDVRRQRTRALKDGRQEIEEEYVPAAFRASQGYDGLRGGITITDADGCGTRPYGKHGGSENYAYVDANGAEIGELIEFD